MATLEEYKEDFRKIEMQMDVINDQLNAGDYSNYDILVELGDMRSKVRRIIESWGK